MFRSKRLSVPDYDALWPEYLAAEHDEDCALRLAYWRLRFPAELGERARQRYADYLRRRLAPALVFAIGEGDDRGLRLLLDLGEAAPEALETALNAARAQNRTEATALLLEARRSCPGAGRARRFDL